MTPVATNKTITVMNRTSDVCQYLKHKKGVDFVLKIVYDILSQHGRFAQKCPVKKNVKYFFKDFHMVEDMVPSFLPLMESRNLFTITYFTKERKKFIPLVTSKIYGGIHIIWNNDLKKMTTTYGHDIGKLNVWR